MLAKKLIFVTGKGGTGKSTVSLCLARKLALQGKKTLLVELGEMSSAKYLAGFSAAPGYLPKPTVYGFDWCLLSGKDCLVDYVSSIVKVEKLTKYFFNSPFMKTLLDIAPGLDDLAILGKLTSHLRNHGPGFDYDHIVVDGHSTGSFTSMIMAPQWLSKMVASGPLHQQSLQISKILRSSENAQTIFVSLYEDLPTEELMESVDSYAELVTTNYSVLINKALPDLEIKDNQTSWSRFMQKKYLKQSEMKQKMSNKFNEVYQQELMVEPLTEVLLAQKSEGELYHSINL